MKKGYKRLLIFQIFLIIILLLNSFFLNILPGYRMPLFLLLLIILFWRLFGIEKDRHRYIKDILLEVSIFIFSFLIIYYLFGLLVGFSKEGDYYTSEGIIEFIIPTILFVITKEYLRYNMTCKSEGNKLSIMITVIVFILFDITQAIRSTNFGTNYQLLLFISYTLLPAITNNITLTYITYKVGYKPTMVYSGIIKLYRYLIPIVPNPSPYIYSIIALLLPVILFVRVFNFFRKDKDEDILRDYNKSKFKGLIIMAIPVSFMIYFISGYFRYHAVCVASGSMSPTIYKGDIVVVDKEFNIENIKEGQVLAIKKNNIIIIHRLVEKVLIDGEYVLYTKGDNNEDIDSFTTGVDEIYGIVNINIPFLGLPTIWFNEL